MTNSEEPSAPSSDGGISSVALKEVGGGRGEAKAAIHNGDGGRGHNYLNYSPNLPPTSLPFGNADFERANGALTGGDHTSSNDILSPAAISMSRNSGSLDLDSGLSEGFRQLSVQSVATSAASSVAPANNSNQQQQPGIPFSLICGEVIEHKTEMADGLLYLTSYRLFIKTKDSTSNLPLGLIEGVECRDIFYLHLSCKDAKSVRATFPNNEAALESLKRIQGALAAPKKLSHGFAFSFYQNTMMALEVEGSEGEEVISHLGWDNPITRMRSAKERFDAEVKRMEFNVQGPWRISDENKDYELCSSYPTHIIVPCVMDRKKLEQVTCFRSARRFPAVVWRHKGNGAVISRCSQPEVGWFGWRSGEDEELVQNIVLACADNSKQLVLAANSSNSSVNPPEGDGIGDSRGGPLPVSASPSLSSIELVPEAPSIKKLLILDARSYTTAVVNRARGGGCECLEYYTNCEIQFMNLANIHSIRKSFINVRQLCSLPADHSNWFSQLENSKWLQHMSGLMKAAVTVATAIENEARPVMVHCSDGWDRTPQIVALAEILLDPYYRSLEGFQVLVEREWLDFGHKFADRCGQGVGSEDANERCPVFLQWLDCLHQLVGQFPTAFEFNLSFIVKLVQHTYSNLFGTFLCNTAKERQSHGIEEITHSVWRFLRAPINLDKFRNNLYSSCEKVLWPSCEVRDLVLWTQVYLGYDNPSPCLTEVINPSQESSPAPSVAADCELSERMNCVISLEKSKARSSSCENLHSPHEEGLTRRKSETNLSMSFSGSDSEEVESRCVPGTENMLTLASTDIADHKGSGDFSATSGKLVAEKCNIKEEDCSSIILPQQEGGVEDCSQKEEMESTLDKRPKSTVAYLVKSIDCSTDTLVGECCTSEEEALGTSMTFTNAPLSISDSNPKLCKTDKRAVMTGAVTASGNGEDVLSRNKTEGGVEGAGNLEGVGYMSVTPQSYSSVVVGGKVVSPVSKVERQEPVETMEGERLPLPEEIISEKIVNGKTENDSVDELLQNSHCEVCATSGKLLLSSAMIHSGGNSTSHNLSVNGIGYTNPTINTAGFLNYSNYNGVQSGGSSGIGSKVSSLTTPMHSRTPSTGFAPTIEESVAGGKANNQQQQQGCGCGNDGSGALLGVNASSYDVDGLMPLRDEVQSRLNVIVSSYKGQINHLQKELQMYRKALMMQMGHKCTRQLTDRQDDAISVADSLCSGEHQSVGNESNSSEISWENIDEKDTRHPLWVPDYAVERCMGCEVYFYFGRRKHHCRFCGKVFCADCSKNTMTMPSEQFFTPVRVCVGCYCRLSNGHASNGSSSGQNTLPSNGPALASSTTTNGLSSGLLSENPQPEISNGSGPRRIQNGHSHHASDYPNSPSSLASSASSLLQRRLSEDIHRPHKSPPYQQTYNYTQYPASQQLSSGHQKPHSTRFVTTLNSCNGAVPMDTKSPRDESVDAIVHGLGDAMSPINSCSTNHNGKMNGHYN